MPELAATDLVLAAALGFVGLCVVTVGAYVVAVLATFYAVRTHTVYIRESRQLACLLYGS